MTTPKVSLAIPNLVGAGAERFAVYLANGLAARGCAVDLVTLEAKGQCLDSIASRVRVVDLKTKRVLRGIVPLARYLRKYKPDVLISNLEHMNLGAILARRLSGASTRVIPVVHISVSQAAAQDNTFRLRALRKLINTAYRWADAVVVVSRDAADDFLQTVNISPQSVRVIYPILTPNIAELAAEPIDHPWFAPGQPPVILSVGRLSEQKDFFTLIKAVAIVRKHRDVRLMIIGEGYLRNRLEEFVRKLNMTDVVALPGYVANAFAHMSRCSLFVSSSAYEGMPMVIVEALAAGAPVVATNCKGGSAEILGNGKYGRLAPVGDPQALAAAILESLAEPRKSFSFIAAEHFCVNTITDQYLALIAEVCNE